MALVVPIAVSGLRAGRRGPVQCGDVGISEAAAERLRAAAGGKDLAPEVAAAIARAVEDASRPESTRAVRSGDRLGCFFNLPLPGGATICMRAYWSVDAATGRKTVTNVESR